MNKKLKTIIIKNFKIIQYENKQVKNKYYFVITTNKQTFSYY